MSGAPYEDVTHLSATTSDERPDQPMTRQNDAQEQGSRLQRLLRERMTQLDLSYAEVARRSGMPRSTVHKIATESSAFPPKLETLAALAGALTLPVGLLREAAIESFGLLPQYAEASDTTRILLAGIEQLPEDRRRELIALVDAMLRQTRAQNDGQATSV